MYNIVTVTFKDSNTATANGVRQWDYGQILRIQGLQLPTAVEVHFALIDSKDSVTRIGITKDGVTDVVIPDSMIEAGKNIFAYVYLRDSESGQTEYEIKIVVTTRAKPEAFDTPEDKELFAQAIEAVNEAADRAEKAGQAATEAAGQAAEDAQQTAQDRAEVAKMVETVTDISEQVKKVEELSNKAQESATQAGASAVATEKAKAQAETAAGKTAEDRIAVNQAKIAVDEVQEAVRADRAAVEEVKQSVEQLSNAIPESTQAGVQAVNQARQTAVDEIARTGTSHKTAVEGAGTQAVESVENVQQVATEAVETAKTEAVQAVQAEGAKQIKEVQDKGAEVLQSIPEDFATQMETKLDKQQGIENKGKALVIGEDGNVVPGEVASGGGDGIAIINTMSGESPLVIPDSAERVNKRLELGGKTEQVQTTGAQLFDASRYEGVTKNGVTVTVKDGVITATGTPNINTWIQVFVSRENYQKLFKPENKIYLKTNKSKDCNYDFGIYGAFGSPIIGTIREGNSGRALPAELPRNDTDFYFFIDVKIGTELKGNIKPIVYHDGDGTWEPYTGGKPSPSPEYPQEIKNSGKWNEETQKHEVTVEKFGKNLFNKSIALPLSSYDVKTGAYWRKYFYLFPNTKYRIRILNNSGNPVQPNSTVFIGPASPEYNYDSEHANGLTVLFPTDAKEKNYIFSTDETGKMVLKAVGYANETNIQENLDNIDIMIYEHSLDDKIEQYIEPKTISLTSDRPITKWDKLVEQGGQIGWLYQSNTVVIDGSETWSSSNVPDHIYFTTTVNNKSGRINTSLCKTYKNNGEPVFNKKHEGEYNIYSDHPTNGVSDTAFVPPNETVTTISQWKEWLNANPIEMLYKTKTTEFVPIPQSEQNAIRALKTYYPTTVITVDGGEVDPDIKVTYTADTKNYIDGKVSAKVASILRQYQADTANLLSLMPMETQATMIENDTNNILNNLESEEAHE